MRKVALVLGGGGAKGAFQCGAEKYAREVKGYEWHIIAGVSVGALNAAMLAMHKYERLYEIWNTISNDKVYTGGFTPASLAKVALGAKSFYDNTPLWNLIQQEIDPALVKTRLKIGTVSLVSGEYVEFADAHSDLQKAVLASTVMPVVWTPVDISPEIQSVVDGGVRNVSPIGDVLDEEPDEIVIINCNPLKPERLSEPPAHVGKIGLRTLNILLNELFHCDLREFLNINAFVQEAAAHGLTLHLPSGRQLRYYESHIIEPQAPLGDTLDFSQEAIQHSLQAGWEQAKIVLGN